MIEDNDEILNEITDIFWEDRKFTNYALWLLLIGFTITLTFYLIRTMPILIDEICQEIIKTDYSN